MLYGQPIEPNSICGSRSSNRMERITRLNGSKYKSRHGRRRRGSATRLPRADTGSTTGRPVGIFCPCLGRNAGRQVHSSGGMQFDDSLHSNSMHSSMLATGTKLYRVVAYILVETKHRDGIDAADTTTHSGRVRYRCRGVDLQSTFLLDKHRQTFLVVAYIIIIINIQCFTDNGRYFRAVYSI